MEGGSGMGVVKDKGFGVEEEERERRKEQSRQGFIQDLC